MARRLCRIFQGVQRGKRFVHGLHGHRRNVNKRLLHLRCFLGNFSQVALHRIKRLTRFIKSGQCIGAHILRLVDGVVDIRELRARLGHRKNRIVYMHRCFGATLAYSFLRLAKRLGNCLNHNITYRFHERGVNGFLERGGAGIGDFRRHRACFHIHVILDVRLLEIARKQREKIFREVFRNNEHRIIASRLKIGHGGIVISELPVQLVVFVQCVDNKRTHIKIARKLVRSALVLVDHCHAHIARVVIGIPKAQHVVPRVQRGQNQKRQHHHNRRRSFEQTNEIALEDCQHVSHGSYNLPIEIEAHGRACTQANRTRSKTQNVRMQMLGKKSLI